MKSDAAALLVAKYAALSASAAPGAINPPRVIPASPPPAASCLRGTRGTRRRPSRYRKFVRDPELVDRCDRVAATGDRERGRLGDRVGKRLVPPANASNSKTPTGPFQTIVPARAMIVLQHGDGRRADVEDHVVRFEVFDRLQRRRGGRRELLRARRRRPGSAPSRGNPSRIACASPTMLASTSDLPTCPRAARMNVLAMPPPTISASTLQPVPSAR